MSLSIQFGDQFVEIKPSRSDVVDFLSNPANKVLTRILEDRAAELILELRKAIRDQDQNNVYAIESYVQCLEDVADLIEVALPNALREQEPA
jgi:hypothetical protein